MKNKRNIDFIVIGAMKSGTTTVHDLLKSDKRIALPYGKEAPFFTDRQKIEEGVDKFIKKFYQRSLMGKCIGKVSPQYMSWYDVAAKNIALQCPKVKLITVLRDPIDRLVSHYCMCVGMGLETRDINQAIQDCFGYPEPAGNQISRINSYVLWSQYGKVLSEYKNRFCDLSERLLILGFDDLVKNQEVFLRRLYKHINIDFGSVQYSYHKSLSRGGGGRVSSILICAPLLTRAVVRIIPHKYKAIIRMKKIEAEVKLHSPNIKREAIDDVLIKRLEDIYRDDAIILQELGFSPYWYRQEGRQ